MEWLERHGGVEWGPGRRSVSRAPAHPSTCYAFGPTVSTTSADPTTVVLRCRTRNNCKVMSVGIALGQTSPCIVHDRINYQLSASSIHRCSPGKTHLRLKTSDADNAPYRAATVTLRLSGNRLRIERAGCKKPIEVDYPLPDLVRPFVLIYCCDDGCELLSVHRPYLNEKRFYLALVALRFRLPDDVCRRICVFM